MRRLTNYWTGLLLVAISVLNFSCDNNEEIQVDPNAEFDAVLEVNEAGPANPNADVNVTSGTGSEIEAKVSFKSTTKDMLRLYITQNIEGAGEVPFEPLENIDLKGDGAVDLTGKNANEFEFQFSLPVPTGITNGTVVYKFWTTTGNGDFRDMSQRLAVGPGTITIRYGSAVNPDAGTADVKSFPDVKLMAPLSAGTSNTFVSLTDGQTYNVNQGIEFVSLWDFGYLYSNADGATLRAPYNYNVPYYPGVLDSPIIDIAAKANTTNDELNKTYFKESTKTVAEFDAIAISSDLSFVSVTQTDANIRVEDLVADDVVEFVDNYGKKGLLKVLQVSGTNGSDGFIRIAIKVQP